MESLPGGVQLLHKSESLLILVWQRKHLNDKDSLYFSVKCFKDGFTALSSSVGLNVLPIVEDQSESRSRCLWTHKVPLPNKPETSPTSPNEPEGN